MILQKVEFSIFLLIFAWANALTVMFIRFDRMYERDRHTDRQTDRHRMTAKAALAYHCAAKIVAVSYPLTSIVLLSTLSHLVAIE